MLSGGFVSGNDSIGSILNFLLNQNSSEEKQDYKQGKDEKEKQDTTPSVASEQRMNASQDSKIRDETMGENLADKNTDKKEDAPSNNSELELQKFSSDAPRSDESSNQPLISKEGESPSMSNLPSSSRNKVDSNRSQNVGFPPGWGFFSHIDEMQDQERMSEEVVPSPRVDFDSQESEIVITGPGANKIQERRRILEQEKEGSKQDSQQDFQDSLSPSQDLAQQDRVDGDEEGIALSLAEAEKEARNSAEDFLPDNLSGESSPLGDDLVNLDDLDLSGSLGDLSSNESKDPDASSKNAASTPLPKVQLEENNTTSTKGQKDVRFMQEDFFDLDSGDVNFDIQEGRYVLRVLSLDLENFVSGQTYSDANQVQTFSVNNNSTQIVSRNGKIEEYKFYQGKNRKNTIASTLRFPLLKLDFDLFQIEAKSLPSYFDATACRVVIQKYVSAQLNQNKEVIMDLDIKRELRNTTDFNLFLQCPT